MSSGPPPGEVHVWLVHADAPSEDELARLALLMSSAERPRHDAYHFQKDKRLFIIARATCRTLLSRYTGINPTAWTFRENHWGRPEIASPPVTPPLRFNLSHTAGLVACALARDREIGIDVEKATRPTEILTIANSVFSPGEIRDLAALPASEQQRRFFELWTLKEAYIKARGKGLAIPLDEFSFTIPGGPTVRCEPSLQDDGDSWQFRLWRPTATHQAALAVRRRDAALEIVENVLDMRELARQRA